ncbi:MAG: DNRLRE domain-containing protein, partial [Anaerolineales bacterium]|nr:DNRLRE domain-containing protein [Anaerolineales bacterium]
MMDETVQAGDVLTFTVKGVALVARYPATNGWTIAMRCGTTCRGWDATTVIPWSTFGGMPLAGATWTLSVKLTDVDGALTPTASTWPPAGAGSLYWGEPDYRGATIAGMQQLNLPLSGDSMLGGATDCGAPDYPNYFPTWGQRNWGTSPYVNVQAQWDAADWPCYSKYYAQWSLAGLPAGAQIVSATLEMRQFGNAGYEPGDTGATVFQLFEVKSAWNESTVGQGPACNRESRARAVYQVPATCEIPNFFCNPGLPVTFDVTEIVRRAASENRTWASVGLYTAAGQYHSGKYLYSREGTEPPVIHIGYVTRAPPT